LTFYFINDSVNLKKEGINHRLRLLQCHVERSRDMWLRTMLALYSRPDSSTQLALSEAERVPTCVGTSVGMTKGHKKDGVK